MEKVETNSKNELPEIQATPQQAILSSAQNGAKLTGYDFYRSLGSPRHICAPMVEQSDLPFRMLTRRYGVDLAYTPMLHSR